MPRQRPEEHVSQPAGRANWSKGSKRSKKSKGSNEFTSLRKGGGQERSRCNVQRLPNAARQSSLVHRKQRRPASTAIDHCQLNIGKTHLLSCSRFGKGAHGTGCWLAILRCRWSVVPGSKFRLASAGSAPRTEYSALTPLHPRAARKAPGTPGQSTYERHPLSQLTTDQ